MVLGICKRLLKTIARRFAYDINSMCAKEVNDMSNGQLQTLRTKTPEEGFKLAVKLAQKGIEVTQPSEEIRKVLRPVYSRDADSLIATSQVVAIHFQTVAFANNYWN